MLGAWLSRLIRTRRSESLSPEWLQAQERKADRVEFIGPSWSWPINKLKNESGRWNQKRLRRSA